ncbi:MAG: hypothetical protein QN178_15350 [Armatimonadota bacterium]|nr:hypothetical protein [Armatimonadota bacterium]
MASTAPLETSTPPERRGLRPGDWVEVRSPEEILATLDERGDLDGLPFMPEMLAHCGRRYQVWKRAEKACDTIHKTGSRRMLDAVHLLGLRCDGSAHGGCQAGCLLFWKEAWLRRAPGPDGGSHPRGSTPLQPAARLLVTTRAPADPTGSGVEVFRCQATQMFAATRPMRWYDPRQYWRDLRCGNVTLRQALRAWLFALSNMIRRRLGRREVPRIAGPIKGRTPAGEPLNLVPGELVEVRSHAEILATLNAEGKNRGLRFDVEMVRYCGHRFRVLRRVERIVDERTGRMMHLPGDCIVLDGVTCVGDRSRKRLFCQRAIYPYWREIWLRRVDGGDERTPDGPVPQPTAPGVPARGPS